MQTIRFNLGPRHVVLLKFVLGASLLLAVIFFFWHRDTREVPRSVLGEIATVREILNGFDPKSPPSRVEVARQLRVFNASEEFQESGMLRETFRLRMPSGSRYLYCVYVVDYNKPPGPQHEMLERAGVYDENDESFKWMWP